MGVVLALYVLVFARGLAWQWGEVGAASGTLPALAPGTPVPAVLRAAVPVAPAAPRTSGAQVAPPAAQGAAVGRTRTPLPPTDAPPPRNRVDELGVSYDAAGVAVMGIDADPAGVYNVPPGRQVRIGGPAGSLYDVQPDGTIRPATRVKEWPG
jgi:hypothetical protein